ncbi:MAG: SDR family NAD(P)-dependent oxidoreductase [Cytophagales bacterium]|nr:SDR family NAD(P)-dependent oxidoreductase [Cytophagales bacterium]
MKTALITGGSKGIGSVVAEKLLFEGYNLIITYNNDKNSAENLLADFKKKYEERRIDLIRLDCGDLNSVPILSDYFKENNINVDVIIFNAGYTDRSEFVDIKLESWSRVFDVNINFPVFLLQKLFRQINPNGTILFTGSIMGIHPHSSSLSYGISKSAVHSLVKNLVKVFSDRKIRVNAIAPGFVNTTWQNNKPIDQITRISKKIALERFCEPSELVNAYWLLIENSYINGEVIVVDGGYLFC